VENGRALKELLVTLKRQGKKVAAYGAAAKASTLLSLSQLDRGQIEYIVDNNADKYGLYMPATSLQVDSPKRLLSDPVDIVLILAWNYSKEIMHDLDWFSQGGGQFIVPIPKLQLISSANE